MPSLLLKLYNFLIRSLLCLKPFSTSLSRFCKDRENWKNELLRWDPVKVSDSSCALFYCSSAGEYEQARPLIEMLQQRGWKVLVLFFSSSGIDFVKARKDPIPCLLAPIDDPATWQSFFEIYRPDLVCVIRHEFWPNFLRQSAQKSLLLLLNYSRPLSPEKFFRKWLKGSLLSYFHEIHCVSENALQHLSSEFSHKKIGSLFVSGDSKYDRAAERAEKGSRESIVIAEFPIARSLVCGSVWPEDISMLAPLLRHIQNNDEAAFLVPHEIVGPVFDEIKEQLAKEEIELQPQPSISGIHLLPKMGILAELYHKADKAWVGGASHHKVHNVLEPIFNGIPVAFGPKYQNSQEAVDLVAANFACSLDNSLSIIEWWKNESPLDEDELFDYLNQRCGSAGKIFERILELMRG